MTANVSLTGLICNTLDVVQTAGHALRVFCSHVTDTLNEPLDSRIKLLLFELESSIHKLEEWKELWSPEDLQSEASFSLLWGQAGQREIRSLLKKVQNPGVEIVNQAEELKNTFQSPARSSSGGSWMPWSFSLPGVSSKSSTARNRLNRSIGILVSAVGNLMEAADTHFRLMHATSPADVPPNHQWQHAAEPRMVSTAIYNECKQSGLNVDLDLNLLNNENDIDKFPDLFDWRDLKLGYQMVVSSDPAEEKARRIRLELISQSEVENSESDFPTQSHANGTLQLLEMAANAEFQFSLDMPGRETEIWLRGSSFEETPLRSLRVVSTTDDSSNGLGLSGETTTSLSVPQKVTLAYRIVESALFLLGTPWMYHLSSDQLMDNGYFRANGQCSLHINFVESTVVTTSHDAAQIWQQIRSIGVMLIEIALERSCSDVGIVTRTLFDKMATEVESLMGSAYMQACQHCLQLGVAHDIDDPEGTKQAPSASTKLMAAYYTEVFLRLRDCLHLAT